MPSKTSDRDGKRPWQLVITKWVIVECGGRLHPFLTTHPTLTFGSRYAASKCANKMAKTGAVEKAHIHHKDNWFDDSEIVYGPIHPGSLICDDGRTLEEYWRGA